jgi:hypothetical protein
MFHKFKMTASLTLLLIGVFVLPYAGNATAGSKDVISERDATIAGGENEVWYREYENSWSELNIDNIRCLAHNISASPQHGTSAAKVDIIIEGCQECKDFSYPQANLRECGEELNDRLIPLRDPERIMLREQHYERCKKGEVSCG